MAISALITGSGGGFLFEQTDGSPYHIENIEWDRGIPGGDTSATIWTSLRGTFQLPTLYSTVILSDLVGPWWLGILDAVELQYWNTDAGLGANVVLRAVGWAAIADDLVYLSRQVFEVGETAGDMFRHARDQLCPGISTTDAFIAASAETALDVESKNFRGDPALAVWNTAAAMGSTYADADPLIWKVRAPMGAVGHPASTPVLEVYAAPDAPSYTIDLAHGYSVRTKVERQQVRNHIIVNYGMGGTGDVLHEPAEMNALAEAFSTQGWAELNYRARQMWVDSSSEFRAAPFLAQRVADCNLAKYGVVHGSGLTLSIPFDGTGGHPIVVDPGPDTIPIWRMDVGYLLNIDNDQTWGGLPNNPTQLITQIHGSLKEGQVQVTTGVLGDSRHAQRMTGVNTLRQAMDVPPLARPNRPEEWQRIEIEHNFAADGGIIKLLTVEFPHILRTIVVYAIAYTNDDPPVEATLNGVTIRVVVGPQGGGTPSEELVPATTISEFRTMLENQLDRLMAPGQIYGFYAYNADPSSVYVLIQLGADRVKVVE